MKARARGLFWLELSHARTEDRVSHLQHGPHRVRRRQEKEMVGEAGEKLVNEMKRLDLAQVKGDFDTGDDEDFI